MILVCSVVHVSCILLDGLCNCFMLRWCNKSVLLTVVFSIGGADTAEALLVVRSMGVELGIVQLIDAPAEVPQTDLDDDLESNIGEEDIDRDPVNDVYPGMPSLCLYHIELGRFGCAQIGLVGRGDRDCAGCDDENMFLHLIRDGRLLFFADFAFFLDFARLPLRLLRDDI